MSSYIHFASINQMHDDPDFEHLTCVNYGHGITQIFRHRKTFRLLGASTIYDGSADKQRQWNEMQQVISYRWV